MSVNAVCANASSANVVSVIFVRAIVVRANIMSPKELPQEAMLCGGKNICKPNYYLQLVRIKKNKYYTVI